MDKQGKNKRIHAGLYSVIVSVLVIVAFIAVNLGVKTVGARKDLTARNIHSLTKETKKMLEGISDKLEIYCLNNGEYRNNTLEEFLNSYEKACKNMKIIHVDMLTNPNFAKQYTNDTVTADSLVVINRSNDLVRYIPTADMMITDFRYNSQTYAMTQTLIGLDIEGQINAAIAYVTKAETRKIYGLVGHQEIGMGTEGIAFLRRSNYSYETLDLMTKGAVPDDCDILLLQVPQTDYTDAELEAIRNYIAKGNDVLILAYYFADLKNFNKLLADYACTVAEGIVLEGDSNRHTPIVPYEVYPKIIDHEITKHLAKDRKVYFPQASAIVVDKELPENLKIASIFTSSDAAYIKVPVNGMLSTLEKSKSDVQGPFRYGIYARDYATGAEAVIISCPQAFSDILNVTKSSTDLPDAVSVYGTNAYANADVLTSCCNLMAEMEAGTNVRKIMLNEEETIAVPGGQAYAIAGIMIGAMVAVLLIMGYVVTSRRNFR